MQPGSGLIESRVYFLERVEGTVTVRLVTLLALSCSKNSGLNEIGKPAFSMDLSWECEFEG